MPRKNRKEITRETFNNIVSMLHAEKSIGEIAGILNMSRKIVSNHIKKYEFEESFIPAAEKRKATCSKKISSSQKLNRHYLILLHATIR